jgi:hypothetical protein
METLERADLRECGVDVDVADEAVQVLGYSVGAAACRLERALIAAGVRPFTQKSVERYKNSKTVQGFNDLAGGLAIAGFVCFALVFVASITNICAAANADHPPVWWYVICAVLPVLGVGLWWCAAVAAKSPVVWKSTAINQYKKPIPEFALATAIDVKRRCQGLGVEVTLYIDEIDVDATKQQAAKLRDPFLTVGTLNNPNVYYLEVWNEPGFKRERA